MKNDTKILQLQKLVADKKQILATKPQFQPITHCTLKYFNTVTNINTLKHDDLKLLACRLHIDIETAKFLDLGDIVISDYLLTDWLNDIKSKIKVLSYNKELKDLKTLEKRLGSLLSEDKRTELELDDISKLLG